MRLKKSRVAADEELLVLINEGYGVLNGIQADYREKRSHNDFKAEVDNARYEQAVDEWGARVVYSLNGIFPTELEANSFLHPPKRFGTVSSDEDYRCACLQMRVRDVLQALDGIISGNLGRYTDLPLQARLYIEDIDSFRKARDVNPAAVSHLLGKGGYLGLSEETVQVGLERILDESFHKKDWGGEGNDLYTSNLRVNGARTPTAFLLKGNGLRRKTLRIRDCGHNGDQLVRLFESPAGLFVIQFVGNVEENVIKDVEGKVHEKRARGQGAWYCIMNGQDTARVLHAYGKL